MKSARVQAGWQREGPDGCVAFGAAVHGSVHADRVDVERAVAAASLTPPPRSILHAFVFSTCANVMGACMAGSCLVWFLEQAAPLLGDEKALAFRLSYASDVRVAGK